LRCESQSNTHSVTGTKSLDIGQTVPRAKDVLLGGGQAYVAHPGNARFLKVVRENAKRHYGARLEYKRQIAFGVARSISPGGRFVRYEDERQAWIEFDIDTVVTKTEQALTYHYEKDEWGATEVNNSQTTSPLLSDGAVLVALGWILDEITGDLIPMERKPSPRPREDSRSSRRKSYK
jgi:hypothetical protein